MKIKGVIVLELRQGRRGDEAEQSQLASPREQAQHVQQMKTRGYPLGFPATRKGREKKGQSKTDLEGRNLHTVTEADGA